MLTRWLFRQYRKWASGPDKREIEFVQWFGIGIFLAALPLTWPWLTLYGICDLFLLLSWWCCRLCWKTCITIPRERLRRSAEQAQARRAEGAAANTRAIAKRNADNEQAAAQVSAARESLEEAIKELRSHWAKCHELIGDRCPLKQVNDVIENARELSKNNPVRALKLLTSFKDSMTRDAVRIRLETIFEERSAYIASIVPATEFQRLLNEAESQSKTTAEYGSRMMELGQWLESIAGPAKDKWDERRRQDKVEAYERLFNDGDEEKDEENQADRLPRDKDNPFDDEIEDSRESRVG